MIPRVGSRVWTISGLQHHGTVEGPWIDVPSQTGGTIVGHEIRFGGTLFWVKWDTGPQGGHCANRLLCIGPFRTLEEFKVAVRTAGHSARVVFGPAGGVRKFRMEIRRDPPLRMELTSDQASLWWDVLQPLLQECGIKVETEQVKASPRAKHAR